jgi:Na+/H+ antiporter NhaC
LPGGTIGLVQKAGGGLALATLLRRFMTTATSALASCMALCSLIFFDDYSSVLIVGNSMRTAVKV